MNGIASELILIVILIIGSAFFSSSEIAYASANRLRLKHAAETGNRLDRLTYAIYESYDRALITILIGNNLVNIASSSVATVIAIALLGDDGAWVATIIMTVIILTFGEIVPKILASQIADRFARMVSIPLKVLSIITFPLVFLVEKLMFLVDRIKAPEGPSVTEDDIESLIDTVEDEGVLDEDQCDLLQSALDFDEVLAYEIITPRVDMLSIDMDDPYEEILSKLLDSPYSRIPVYEDTVDNIIGILHLNRFLKEITVPGGEGREKLKRAMLPVNFVHKTMPLPDVLKTMKKRQCHMVVVTDEYGGTMGILTMEDVLEQLVGDIWDESDEVVPEFIELSETEYTASGDMRTEDLFEELDIDDRDFEDDNATLGGWAIEMLGGYPEPGASFTYRNLTLTVEELKNLRVTRLHVHLEPLPEEELSDLL